MPRRAQYLTGSLMAAPAMNTADATRAARTPAITALRWVGSCHYGVGAPMVPRCRARHAVIQSSPEINCCLGIGYG